MSRSKNRSGERVIGRYGGVLPPTLKEIVRAYIADYGRREELIRSKSVLSRDEIRLKQINSKIDEVIKMVLTMHGICGEAAQVIAADIKSGVGSRSAQAVSRVGSFLSRNTFIKIQDDVFWFTASELHLY